MSKIPEGATHSCKHIGDYRRLNSDGTWDAWRKDRWEPVFIPRPDCYQPIVWALPTVGTVCEGRNKNGVVWLEITVLAVTDHYLIGREGSGDEFAIRAECWEFRPIRSPEQIVADERNAAILKMIKDCPGATTCMLGALYDAGYRKHGQ